MSPFPSLSARCIVFGQTSLARESSLSEILVNMKTNLSLIFKVKLPPVQLNFATINCSYFALFTYFSVIFHILILF